MKKDKDKYSGKKRKQLKKNLKEKKWKSKMQYILGLFLLSFIADGFACVTFLSSV